MHIGGVLVCDHGMSGGQQAGAPCALYSSILVCDHDVLGPAGARMETKQFRQGVEGPVRSDFVDYFDFRQSGVLCCMCLGVRASACVRACRGRGRE